MEPSISPKLASSSADSLFNSLQNSDMENAASPNTLNIAESQIYSSLQSIIGNQQITPSNTSAAEGFNPEKVAKQIVSYIESAIDKRSNSAVEKQSMLAQAREGVAQGIDEVEDILSSLGRLSEPMNKKVHIARALIFKGLDKLEANNNVSEDKPLSKQSQKRDISIQAISRSSNELVSRQASIQIETRDGDLLTIDLSSTLKTSRNQINISQGNTQLSAYQNSTQASVEFSYSLQGTLDSSEQKAIDNLLNDIAKLANKFFSGDVQQAFNQALSLGIDANELASFSLDLNSRRSSEVINNYQTIENIAPKQPKLPARIADAVNYAENIRQLLKPPTTNLPFNQPITASADIYSLFIKQQMELTADINPRSDYLLKQLLNQFL